MSFTSICWDITSRCNDNCKFCYRDQSNLELSLEQNKEILKKLILSGVKKISFVGGEPLLYNQLYELVGYGKSIGKGNVLFSITTNGIVLDAANGAEKSLDNNSIIRLLSFFDWITFSLDGPNQTIQNEVGRNFSHFDRIIWLLNFLKTHNVSNRIKINTVVCRPNIMHLNEMLDLLYSFEVNRWKLFKFLPSRGNALYNERQYSISDEEYQEAIRMVLAKNSVQRLKITTNDYRDFSSYVSITSDGYLSVYCDGQYKKAFDFLHEDIILMHNYVNVEINNERRNDFSALNL